MMMRGRTKVRRLCTLWMKCRSMASVTSKSAMTPSLHRSDGHDAARGFAQHFLASMPTASTRFFARWLVLTATTEGSLSTMPLPLT